LWATIGVMDELSGAPDVRSLGCGAATKSIAIITEFATHEVKILT